MTRRAFALLAPALLFASAAQAADPVQGVWVTPSGSAKVKVAPCGGSMCGTVVWLKAPLDKTGKPVVDAANPDPALRARPVVGLTLIRDYKPAGAGKWTGGKAYDPQTGRTYASRLSASGDGTLKVEGCIAVVCQAQTWKRAE